MKLEVGTWYLYDDKQGDSLKILVYEKSGEWDDYNYFNQWGWIIKGERMINYSKHIRYGIIKGKEDELVPIERNYKITKERLYFDFIFKYSLSEQIVD